MNVPSRVILVGGFIEIVELCVAAGVEIIGIIDNRLTGSFAGCPILGDDDDAARILDRQSEVPVHVTPDSPARRQSLAERYANLGAELATLVHPSAIISSSVMLGEGCVIQAGAHVSASVTLGHGVKVNTCANITHDVEVGDFATIAPSAVLLGRTRIGAQAYVGANATILPGVSIGRGATVGAGTTVTRDVPDGAVYVGVAGRSR